VLRAAQADALGTEVACLLGVRARVGVGPHRELALADLVGPPEDRVELLGALAGLEVELPYDNLTGRAVDRERVALLDRGAVDGERLALDLDLLGAHDRRLAPAAGHDGRVADEAATRREDALGRGHAVHVLRRRLGANEDD